MVQTTRELRVKGEWPSHVKQQMEAAMMLGDSWLAERADLSAKIIRSWLEAGILRVEVAGQDEKRREGEIAAVLGKVAAKGVRQIEAIRAVAERVREELKEDMCPAATIDVIEAAREHRPAFVAIQIVRCQGEPEAYEVNLYYTPDKEAAGRDMEAAEKEMRSVGQPNFLPCSIVDLTAALAEDVRNRAKWPGE